MEGLNIFEFLGKMSLAEIYWFSLKMLNLKSFCLIYGDILKIFRFLESRGLNKDLIVIVVWMVYETTYVNDLR